MRGTVHIEHIRWSISGTVKVAGRIYVPLEVLGEVETQLKSQNGAYLRVQPFFVIGYLDLLKVKKQTRVSGKHYIILEALKIFANCRNY